MTKAFVLVVDDDPKIANLVKTLLEQAGCKVQTTASIFQARGALARARPDLMILDRGLPDMEGLDFLKEIRAQKALASLPVLFLTAKGSAKDRIEGLSGGSDDYLVKPFVGGELKARVEALLRRSALPKELPHVLIGPSVEINLDRREVRLRGKKVGLPPKEFDLLAILMEKRGRVLSRDFLLEAVWGAGMSLRLHPKNVDITITRLRKILGSWGSHICAVQSQGYRLDAE